MFAHRRIVLVSSVIAIALLAAGVGRSRAQDSGTGSRLLAGAQFGATPSQLARAAVLQPWAEDREWPKTRGMAQDMYARVAPAVALIRSPWGHGTGIIVDPSGWIVTNHHVVAQASTDVISGAKTVTVHLGVMSNGLMQLSPEGITAQVYKENAEKDLALLKLTKLPGGATSLASLPFAQQPPLPGAACIAVGHPSAGMLWTIRSCEVSNVGQWPDEQIDFVMQRLRVTSDADRSALQQSFSSMPKLKVVVSSCGINPGDSGGPLLNSNGELVAVTFAIPTSNPQSGVNLDKFAYHIHVDEVRKFLEQRPDKPALHVPDAWPPASVTAFVDADEDGSPDVIAFALGPEGPLTGVLVDLDQNQLPGFARAQLAKAPIEPKWDFEFAWQPGPEQRVFYDTNNDGQFELVLIDVDLDGQVDVGLEDRSGTWIRNQGLSGTKMLVRERIPAPMRTRFDRVIETLAKEQPPATAKKD